MTGAGRRSLKIVASGAASGFVLAIALAVQPGPAAAQTAPPAQASLAPAVQLPEAFADDIEVSIAELHRTLKIQPSQEAFFNAFAEVMRGNAHVITALFVERTKATDFTAPARMHWYAQINMARAEGINRLVAPFDALYQALSEPQKALADSHFEQLRQRRSPSRTN